MAQRERGAPLAEGAPAGAQRSDMSESVSFAPPRQLLRDVASPYAMVNASGTRRGAGAPFHGEMLVSVRELTLSAAPFDDARTPRGRPWTVTCASSAS